MITGGRRSASALGGLLIVAVLVTLALAAAPAWASSDLSVSSPAAPIVVKPGELASFKLQIGNVGHDAIDVTLADRRVVLSENGQTFFADTPDPVFAAGTRITPNRLHLRGRQQKSVTVTIRIPKDIRSDDYFIGILATPVVGPGVIRAVNNVGALIVLNVPGLRNPRLSAQFVNLPRVVFGSSVKGSLRARSTGVSTLQFTTDTQVTGFVAPRPPVTMEPAHLLPPGLYWDVPVRWSSWLGLGWYTVRCTLVYNVTDQRTADVVLSRTVFVIAPFWFLVPAFIVAVLVLLIWRRRRRRSSLRRGTASLRGA